MAVVPSRSPGPAGPTPRVADLLALPAGTVVCGGRGENTTIATGTPRLQERITRSH
ncbi:hypothetical protein [Kitasatospora sp. NBC_01539]|uniref:hypothetical protein n=1 Tax=Kitasatospora sp. NBC_01539 TaxID=2903577 RepID=UPI0038600C65